MKKSSMSIIKTSLWYLVTLVFTGILFLLHFVWKDAGNYSISFTQLAPFFGTALFLYITKDSDNFNRIKNGLRLTFVNTKWYALSLIIPFTITALSGVLLTFIFSIEFVPWNVDCVFFFLNFIAILVGSIGEEIGWRGYLFPMVCKYYNPLVSSIIVGTLWGIWHLNYASDFIFWILFIVNTIEISVILTLLLNKTKGDLWTSIAFHTAFNLANRIFIYERFNTSLLLIEIIIMGLVCIIITLPNRHKGYLIYGKNH